MNGSPYNHRLMRKFFKWASQSFSEVLSVLSDYALYLPAFSPSKKNSALPPNGNHLENVFCHKVSQFFDKSSGFFNNGHKSATSNANAVVVDEKTTGCDKYSVVMKFSS